MSSRRRAGKEPDTIGLHLYVVCRISNLPDGMAKPRQAFFNVVIDQVRKLTRKLTIATDTTIEDQLHRVNASVLQTQRKKTNGYSKHCT